MGTVGKVIEIPMNEIYKWDVRSYFINFIRRGSA